MDRDKLAGIVEILKNAAPPKTISTRKAIDELLPHIERLISLGYTQKQVAAMLHGQITVTDNTLRSYVSAALKAKKGRRPQRHGGGADEPLAPSGQPTSPASPVEQPEPGQPAAPAAPANPAAAQPAGPTPVAPPEPALSPAPPPAAAPPPSGQTGAGQSTSPASPVGQPEPGQPAAPAAQLLILGEKYPKGKFKLKEDKW